MKNPLISKEGLERLSNLDWFDAMCQILTKENQPTTRKIIELTGIENKGISRERRGSMFLLPYDKRFDRVAINPDLFETDDDKPVDYLSVSGLGFKIILKDVIKRFPSFVTQRNIYDGGTQIFFYPIPEHFEFSALEFWTNKEPEELKKINKLEFNSVSFQFGGNKIHFRDGYSMKK